MGLDVKDSYTNTPCKNPQNEKKNFFFRLVVFFLFIIFSIIWGLSKDWLTGSPFGKVFSG